MLNKDEIELIEYMDYQVLNNGMDGWLGNRGYERVFDYISILNKRNSDLDQNVASIFKKATIAGIGYFQHRDSIFIPEIKVICDEYEQDLRDCSEQYRVVAKQFMNSYGLVDHLTNFQNEHY